MNYSEIKVLANGTFERIDGGTNSKYEVRLCRNYFPDGFINDVVSVLITSPDKTYHEALYNPKSFVNILTELLADLKASVADDKN